MQIAFISDIHGNRIGLDAVLADVEANHNVDAYWFGGDYSLGGPDPVGVLERIRRLSTAVYVRGNADRRVYEPAHPLPFDVVAQRPELIPLLADVTAVAAWGIGAVVSHGWLDWFMQLPVEQRLRLPDGTNLLMVHASPGHDSGDSFFSRQTDEQLIELAGDCADDVIVVGHTHDPGQRHVGRHHWVNPGSVGNPMNPDPRASYAILNADESGYEFTLHRVDYDRDAVITMARERLYPNVQDLIDFFNGIHAPDRPWY
jgi:predicted phosphodiesterase